MENPKDSTKILLELIREFSKVAAYKNQRTEIGCTSIQHNKAAEKEIQESIPFTIAPKIPLRYLGITKEVKGLYAENYRKLMKETEEDAKK